MTRLLLIRHPETDWNVQGRYQGQSDVPINATGWRQARELADGLRGTRLAAVFTSDLSRAKEAAALIAGATGAPLHIDRRLREIHQGDWEGMLSTEISARFPELLAKRREAPLEFVPPNGEPASAVLERIIASIREIAVRFPGQAVAVVSHGFALALVRFHFCGHDERQIWDLVPGSGEIIELGIPDAT